MIPASTTAVVVHLFYADSWRLFAQGLKNLQSIPFDLFVTMPPGNRTIQKEIQADFPEANVVVVPNRGRGTLPFIKIVRVLMRHGYEVVLKLHCRKPQPSRDSRSFLSVVVECLLPASRPLLEQIIGHLSSPDTAMIGPSEVYLPLYVSLPANEHRLLSILGGLTDHRTALNVLARPETYGFFAGSMFWARLDAIEPLLRFSASDFELEHGQLDGTLAHSLERAFTLWPQLQGLHVLECTGRTIRARPAESINVPWWLSPPISEIKND